MTGVLVSDGPTIDQNAYAPSPRRPWPPPSRSPGTPLNPVLTPGGDGRAYILSFWYTGGDYTALERFWCYWNMHQRGNRQRLALLYRHHLGSVFR